MAQFSGNSYAGRFGIGQAYRRVEDQRFLTGTGRYTDDIHFPNQAYIHFVRSAHSHGEIVSINTIDAEHAPGVLAIYTCADLDAAGIKDLPVSFLPPDRHGVCPDALPRPSLARDRVRFVGEPMVAIVAESKNAALAAADLVDVTITDLPSVGTIDAALQDGAPAIWPHHPGNVFADCEIGDRNATDEAFAHAARVVAIDLVNNRLAPTSLEPRGCVALHDEATGGFTLYQGTQGAHIMQRWLANLVFGVALEQMHVITPDVGGGFGMKMYLLGETVAALFAARALGRPVRWIADRTESFTADIHGRDHVTHAELALDEDSKALALRVSDTANVGAYISQSGMAIAFLAGVPMLPGAYDIPVAYAESKITLTNTTPVDAYRGAGRPEALYVIERLMDKAGRETGLGPVEIRRRNLVDASAFPYTSALGKTYESGDFQLQMDKALERADADGFEQRRRSDEAKGLLRGLGVGFYVEICAPTGGESPHVTLTPDGGATVLIGTQSNGQGHETAYAQMVADDLGLELDRVEVVQGDTARVPTGSGTSGSRSLPIGGGALVKTLDAVIENGRTIAAEILEAAPQDIDFEPGLFRVTGTDRTVSLSAVVTASYDEVMRPEGIEPGLHASETFTVEEGTYPSGCHVCEVVVDPETGAITLDRYTAQDDVGVVLNPLLLEGQIVGGIAQGVGQALFENAVYDATTAQMLTGSFMDYAMPRADDLPTLRTYADAGLPSTRNPLGVKGAGEAGTIGAPATVVHAVLNALAPLGVTELDMPLTPQAVWSAIQGAKPS